MAKDKDTHHWVAQVSVALQPVNQYGDPLPDGGEIEYSVKLQGSLLEVVARLEGLQKPRLLDEFGRILRTPPE